MLSHALGLLNRCVRRLTILGQIKHHYREAQDCDVQQPFDDETNHGHGSHIPLVLDESAPEARIHIRLVDEDASMQAKTNHEQNREVAGDILSLFIETRHVATKGLRCVKRQN